MTYSPFEDSQAEQNSIAGENITGPDPAMSCSMCPIDESVCGSGRGYPRCVKALQELENGDQSHVL